MTAAASTYFQALQLLPHPESGFYRETYRSQQKVAVAQAGDGALVAKNASTGIYFLLEPGNFSAFHTIHSDEMWHVYAGDALQVLELADNGELRCTRLGPDLLQGEVFQHVVPAHTWFASRLAAGGWRRVFAGGLHRGTRL